MSISEPHIVIDSRRAITVPEQLKRIAVQFDHNVETVTFDCPRYWDGHDLSAMDVYIICKVPDGGIYRQTAANVTVDGSDDSIMHFDWTITNDITSISGKLAFNVCIKDVDANGTDIAHWNSDINKDMYISKGLEVD